MGLSAVDQLLAEVADDIGALESPALKAIAPILAKARREAAAGFEKWLAAAPDAEERFTAQQYRNVLVQLDGALSTIAGIKPVLVRGLARADAAAGPLAVSHVELALQAFAKKFGGSVTRVPMKQALHIVQSNATLMQRFRTSAARYAGDVGQDIRRELAVGLVRHETVRELTQRLVKQGGPKGNVAIAGVKGEVGARVEHIAEGLFRRYDYWAQRVVRTEVINAYNVHADEGIAATQKLDPRVERMWSAAMDRRLCPVCQDLDGKVAPVGSDFPGGFTAPPAHPNCRCAVVAWRSDWSEAASARVVTVVV